MISPPNAFCAAYIVKSSSQFQSCFTAKMALFYFCNIFVNFYSDFRIFERIIHHGYYFILAYSTVALVLPISTVVSRVVYGSITPRVHSGVTKPAQCYATTVCDRGNKCVKQLSGVG